MVKYFAIDAFINGVGIITYELNNKHELFDKCNDIRIATFLPK